GTNFISYSGLDEMPYSIDAVTSKPITFYEELDDLLKAATKLSFQSPNNPKPLSLTTQETRAALGAVRNTKPSIYVAESERHSGSYDSQLAVLMQQFRDAQVKFHAAQRAGDPW